MDPLKSNHAVFLFIQVDQYREGDVSVYNPVWYGIWKGFSFTE